VFTKVLIANRGEIAVRIARTLREMGILSVAVCSEPDVGAHHTRVADEVVAIGGDAPASSYLDVDKIVAAAKETGAEAVHPGYGFLSESPTLPAALDEAGIAFIGPPAEVLARAGDKTTARTLMLEAGVPVVPGMNEPEEDPAKLAAAAEEIGFPLLIKAAAGGGGRGMRVVERAEELAEAAASAASEAKAAFGDGSVYLERYLVEPRHVEVQILADGHGHVVHLFERECSLQRRHQKIVEETPCVALDDELRSQMFEAAVTAARAVGYQNAGTVEFLLDRSREFFFLEINARLQVEHPITEAVTGLDLVRHQLEVAAGGELPFEQSQLESRGHAIECRIYAEDPSTRFGPSPGTIVGLGLPEGPGVRFDGGVRVGSEVPVHYDPILGKLVTWAEDRPAAVERMLRALSETTVLGVQTPVELLVDLLATEAFQKGETHTGLVEAYLESWQPSAEADLLVATALLAQRLAGVSPAASTGTAATKTAIDTPWQRLGAWKMGR